MKRFLVMLAVVTTLVLVNSGCTSVEYAYGNKSLRSQQLSSTGQTRAHINVTTTGLYFIIWPIVSSSTATEDNVAWFEDTVNVSSTVGILTDKATNYLKGTKTLDLTTRVDSLGWLFSIKRCQASANIVR